jgi:predicted PurR-regulated permease PerM
MSPGRGARSLAARAATFWGVAALFVVALWLLRAAAQPLLLLFAGVLFGTSLRGAAEFVARNFGWRVGWSLAACFTLALLVWLGAMLWIVPSLVAESADLIEKTKEAIDRLQAASPWSFVRRLLPGPASGGQQLRQLLGEATGALATAAGLLGSVVFVLFVSLYVAVSPAPYRQGLIRLVPPRHRERARELLDALAQTLRRWLLGRAASMLAVGIATALGTWALGIPLAPTLGVLAGVLGFVPNIGPIVSAVPAVLVAFTVSPLHALYALGLYLSINLADGYGLTPWLQRRAVSLPPALILSGQIVTAALWGVLGVILSTPLLACLVVLIRTLYVEDTLEPGGNSASPASRCPPQSNA